MYAPGGCGRKHGDSGGDMNSGGDMKAYGLTIPLTGVPLHAHRDLIAGLADLGYTDVWSAEAGGADAFTPLALASAWAPTLRLGTAIVPAFTRGAATIAQSAAALADAAPGRVAIGIGTSSDVIVARWNGIPFEKPYERVRDVVRFLREALAGGKVTREYETFTVDGFRLLVVPEVAPRLLVAALRPGMLRLAGREADGAIINWLSADDVRRVIPYVHEAGPDKEIVARIFVAPTADPAAARTAGRAAIAGYLTVPVYRAFHEWLGRSDVLGPMWSAWAAGDRRAAVAAIPDEVVDSLVVHGPPDQCRQHVARYVESGVTTPVLALLPVPGDPRDHVRSLAPLRT
jgi:probable F420-dependent oxidoreductase